jgi:PEP-CTERM motif
MTTLGLRGSPHRHRRDGQGRFEAIFAIGGATANDLAFTLNGTPNAAAVPEPSNLIVAALGALGLIGYSRRPRRAAA